MKYIRQFGILLIISTIGEILRALIPLPIPGSIYGLVLLFLLLSLKILKLSDVEETGDFLLAIMPLLFIPAGVGVMKSWFHIRSVFLPLAVITVVTTLLVFIISGKTTDFLLDRRKKK